MIKTISQRLLYLWEKGSLYIILGGIVYALYSLTTNVGVVDWQKELTYFNYIKTSLQDSHSLPYFWWNKLENVAWYPPIMVTAAFIAIPETPLFSPIIPLIMFMSAISFIKLYMFLMFVVGAIGIIKLKKQLEWNDIQFRTYSAMYLFSPIIMQHLAVGYSPWINLFLFPWLAFFLAEKKIWRSSIGLAGTMALVLLQGGIYTFVWFMMLFMMYSLFSLISERNWQIALRMAAVPLLVLLLAMVRIYSTSYAYSGFSREWFLTTGYNPFTFLAYALTPTLLIEPFDLLFYRNMPGLYPGFPPHDAGLFWGFSIVMLLVVAFNYKKIIRPHIHKNNINNRALLFTALTFFIFSYYTIWTFFTKTLDTYLYLPFYESIKNYGFRLAVPAYLGFTVVLANNTEKVWQILNKWLMSKSWQTIKNILISIYKYFFIGLSLIWLLLKLFRGTIITQFNAVIKAAYNGERFAFLKNRMEGLGQNDLNFYYIKADNLYSSVLYWMMVALVLLFIILLFNYILKKTIRTRVGIRENFPYIKFEMLLVLPLLFSISMWTKLATSIPYTEFPVQEILAPTVVIETEDDQLIPEITVTPKNMLIKQRSGYVSGGYVLPQILSRDHKYLSVDTKNAALADENGYLKIHPIDGEDIAVSFNTKNINITLLITAISWLGVIIYFIASRKSVKINKL